MSEGVKCPKCNLELDSKAEFEEQAKGLIEGNFLDSILEVNAKNWEDKILQSNLLVVVEFWHENCPSCKSFAPTYIEVAKEYKGKLKFAKLNVLMSKDNRDVAVKYGLVSTPSLVFFCDGKVIATKVGRDGFETKERFKQLINDMINKCPHDREKS